MEQDIPQKYPDQIDHVTNGSYYRMQSIQMWNDEKQKGFFYHIATEITSRAGLEKNATVSISFRPGIEEMTVHRIRIHRADEIIDLADKVTFELFRRETELEKGILDGYKTAFVNLENVRVGDIVEYSYSLSYLPILLPTESFFRTPVNFNAPVGLIHRRFTVPQSQEINVKSHGRQQTVRESVRDGMRSYELTIANGPISESENSVPSWFEQRDMVDFSSISDWRKVVEDSIPHYVLKEDLPEHFRTQLDDIAAQSGNEQEKVARVLALIQRDVRYVGVEIGRGAFIPRPPNLVLQRGYGDCKDKSLLMVAALRHLGIESHPALAHLEEGEALKDRLPSPYLFNHVIVRVELEGELFYLDPTGTAQLGTRLKAAQSHYGYVLPIMDGVSALEHIDPFIPVQPSQTVEETFSFQSEDANPPLTLRVKSAYRDDDAHAFRRKLASTSRSKLESDYLSYYRKTWAGIEKSSPLKVMDDKIKNVISLEENYVFKNVEDVKKLTEQFYFVGDNVRNIIKTMPETSRNHPINLPFPIYRSHVTRVENLKSDYVPPDSVSESYGDIYFRMDSTFSDKALTFYWNVSIRKPFIEAGKLEGYNKIAASIDENTSWYYNLGEQFKVSELEENLSSLPVLSQLTDDQLNWFWENLETILLVVLSVTILALFVISFWRGLVWDKDRASDALYYPVAVWKVAIMTLFTGGAYAAFWFYRFWRWEKLNEGKNLWVIPRALFFGVLAFKGLENANSKSVVSDRVSGKTVLFVLAAGWIYIIMELFDILDSDAPVDGPYLIYLSVSMLFCLLTVLPVARQVQRINLETDSRRAVLQANSRITALNVIGLILGICLLLSLVVPWLLESS